MLGLREALVIVMTDYTFSLFVGDHFSLMTITIPQEHFHSPEIKKIEGLVAASLFLFRAIFKIIQINI